MEEKIGLKRCLGKFEVTVYGLGIIVGAGIYSLLGKAVGIAGGGVWMAYGVSAIVAGLTALSFAELSSHFPKSCAVYTYTDHAFRRKWFAFLIGWLAIYNMIATAATVSLGFGGYFSEMLISLGITGVPILAAAIVLIILLSLLNFKGIKESVDFGILLTAVEIIGLLIIVVLGWSYIGSVDYTVPKGGFGGVMTAALLVFFAYLGFENVANMSDETKNAKNVIPHGLLIALGLSTVLYMAVSITAVSVVPMDVLAASDAPLAIVAEAAMPGYRLDMVLSFIAFAATLTTVLASMIAASRMIWSMSKEGGMPRLLSKVHPKHQTPWVAVILVLFVTASFATIGNIETVAKLSDFGAFLMFAVVNLSVIILRYRTPSYHWHPGQFQMPINIGRFPVLAGLGLAANMFMLFFFSQEIFFAGAAVMGAGLAAYWFLRKLKLISI